MTELKSFKNLRSVSEYVKAWNYIHRPDKIKTQNVYLWISRGVLKSQTDGSPHGIRIEDGLDVEKHTRAYQANSNFCDKCARFFENLPKHMKRHELIDERIVRFEAEEAKRNNGSTS